MNYKEFQVEVLDETDATREAWLTSKPTIKYESEEELQDTIRKMCEQDLPLSAFRQFHLKITSSILFRDLLFTIRPCIAWSSSFRINPIVPDRIFIEDNAQWDSADDEIMNSGMTYPYEQFQAGVALDIVKLKLYLGTITQYVISIDSRTLMCLIATLKDLDEEGFQDHIQVLLAVLGYSEYDDMPSTSANSLFDKLKVGDDTNYSDAIPNKDFHISDYYPNSLGFGVLDVVVDASTGGQFLRQHFSILRCQLFDKVKELGYKNVCMMRCEDRFRYMACGQTENFQQLIRRRICWAAHTDHEYETSGIISWSDILKPLIKDLSAHDFAKLLPCRCNYQRCSVSEETRLRLWKVKGIDGVIPDDNPCCPILVGDPKMVDIRGKFYGSNSIIYNKWKSLVENGILREKDTKWKEECDKYEL